MSDLLAANFSPVQTAQQNTSPPTIASAATIAPTNRLTFVTGTVPIATITPPVTGHHELVIIHTNGSPGVYATTGNIKAAVTPAQNVPVIFEYDPATALYWGGTLKAS